jgi:hypothetical protein
MARQNLNYGTNPNDGTGDTLRNAMDKINDNFIDLYGETAVANNLTFGVNTISASNTNGNVSIESTGTGTVQVNRGLLINTDGETSNSIFYASDDTTLLTVDVSNKRIGINKTTPTSTLDVVGSASITGNVALAASATLGTTVADRLTIVSTVFGNLIPGTAYTLGTSSNKWNEAHVTTGNFTGITSTTINATTIVAATSITGDITGQLTTTDPIRLPEGAFLSSVSTDTLTGNRAVKFPDRSGTLASVHNSRLTGPYGSPPATAIGGANDIQGDIAADDDYIYYCIATYDGIAAIWKRTAISTW